MTEDERISDPREVEWRAREAAQLAKGLCPDSGLRLHYGGEGPVGTLSCDMCDCFGYDPPLPTKGEKAMSDKDPLLYSIRDLGENAGAVIGDIRAYGGPAVITHYGRFVAVIHPLPDGIEGALIGRYLAEIIARRLDQMSLDFGSTA